MDDTHGTAIDHPAVMVAIPSVAWMWTAAVRALLQLELPSGSQIIHEDVIAR